MSEKKHKSISSSRSDCHQPFGKGLILQVVEIVLSVQPGRMTKKETCLACGVNKRILNAWLLQDKRQDMELPALKQEDVMNEKRMPDIQMPVLRKNLRKQN